MHTYPTRADARMVLASLAATALLAACGNNEDSGVARGAIVSERTVSTVTRAALDASTAASGVQLLSGTAKCDVSVRQITYATPGPTGAISNVWPSAGARATRPTPMLPLAPGRLSTTTGCANRTRKCSASARPCKSGVPPVK